MTIQKELKPFISAINAFFTEISINPEHLIITNGMDLKYNKKSEEEAVSYSASRWQAYSRIIDFITSHQRITVCYNWHL
jgi:hypothetical protein